MRSAVSSARVGPVDRGQHVAAGHPRAVGGDAARPRVRGVRRAAKTAAATGRPATTPSARATSSAVSTWSAGMVASLVTSSAAGAEVLGERGVDDPLHLGRVEARRRASCRTVDAGIAVIAASQLLAADRRPASIAAEQVAEPLVRRPRGSPPASGSRGSPAGRTPTATSVGGDGEQVGRLPAAPCGARPRSPPSRGQLPGRRGQRVGRAQHAGAAGHRPLQRARGPPGRPPTPAPVAGGGRRVGLRRQVAGDVRRRSGGRRPGPPAASCWPAGWRRARRCRPPRRRRTGRGWRCGRAGRCGRRRRRSGRPGRPGSARSAGSTPAARQDATIVGKRCSRNSPPRWRASR